MDHDTFITNLPLYALEALSEGETAAMERHLAACAGCRTTLKEYREVLGGLGESLVEPDWAGHSSLREEFRQRLAANSSETAPKTGSPPPSRTPRIKARLAWVAVLLLAVGGWAAAYHNATQLAETKAIIRVISKAPRLALVGQHAPDSQVDLYLHQGQAVVWVRRLPQLPRGHIYEGWWVIDGQVVPAGTFGTGPTLLSMPSHAVGFAITIEPDGGTKKPTTPILASTRIGS